MPASGVQETVRRLLHEQHLAVLATQSGQQPYASLVAVVATPDLRALLFATPRATRKFANLQAEARAAMLIDSRRNRLDDFHDAAAATAVGRVVEVTPAERAACLAIYLERHPHLRDFVTAPSCALMRLDVEAYHVVDAFQHVVEWRPHLEP